MGTSENISSQATVGAGSEGRDRFSASVSVSARFDQLSKTISALTALGGSAHVTIRGDADRVISAITALGAQGMISARIALVPSADSARVTMGDGGDNR
jgi:hypothetical protein